VAQKFSTPLHSIEFDRVVELISLEARTSLGRAALQSRAPLESVEACHTAQTELWELVRYYLREGNLPFSGLIDPRPIFENEALELSAAWELIRTVQALNAVRESFVRTDTYPRLRAIAEGINDFRELQAKVGRYFNPDGTLREEASAELRSIRSKMHSKRFAIQRSLSELLGRHGEAVQDPIITLRGDRYCIPVKAERRGEVPGILHERSGSGASFFIEPMAVVEMNNELAHLLILEREEIARITRFVANELRMSADEIVDSALIAGELDAIQAAAVFAHMIEAGKPRFSDQRELRLVKARHPLLDERVAQLRAEAFDEEPSSRRVIPTTIELTAAMPALLISGPNAGGKTVALKTAGLLVALATSGLPLPASDESVIPVIDHLHVLIGDDQDVLAQLSTFSAYLTRLKRILEKTTSRSMVLLDELGSGTDPEEAGALGAAVLDFLLEKGCLMIVTTHLAALKTHALSETRIQNASMEFDSVSEKPTFHLIIGVPGRSRAIDAAANVGLPPEIIRAARAKLGERYGEVDDLLASLQRNLSDAERLRRELDESRAGLASEQEKIAALRAEIEEERRKVARNYRDEINRIRDDVQSRLGRELRSLKEADRQSREKMKPEEIMQVVTEPLSRLIEPAAPQGTLAVGDEVEHRRFAMKGVVTAIEGERVSFSVNGKRMQADRGELIGAKKPPPKPVKEPKKTKATTGEDNAETVVVGAELNLIGQRVDEALDESDKFLDRSLMDGRQAVRIIHGHGSGKLRKALREHFRKHPAIRSFRPGDDHEGGDGATIAVLDI